MLISELAQKTGLTSHTLRYYEKEGLLPERYIQRGENRYRHYTDDVIERIRAIQALQTAGFTLLEIRDIMERWDAGLLTPGEGAIYLQQKIEDVLRRIDTKIVELEQAKVAIKRLSDHVAAASRVPERK